MGEARSLGLSGYLFSILALGEAATGFEFAVLAVADYDIAFTAFVALFTGFFGRC